MDEQVILLFSDIIPGSTPGMSFLKFRWRAVCLEAHSNVKRETGESFEEDTANARLSAAFGRPLDRHTVFGSSRVHNVRISLAPVAALA